MTVYYVLNQLGPHSKGDVLSFSPEQIGAGVDISHLTSIGAIRVASGGEIARAVPAQIQATHAPQGVGVFTNNGVPDSTSYAGVAAYGSLCWNVAVSPPTIYVNTGTIAAPTWTIGGGSGSGLSLPGVTSDGLTPGGIVVAGAVAVTGAVSASDIALSGLTGSTHASRWVGTTPSGAPTTGAHLVGDYATSLDGKTYTCTVAGTPGTWINASIPGLTSDGANGVAIQSNLSVGVDGGVSGDFHVIGTVHTNNAATTGLVSVGGLVAGPITSIGTAHDGHIGGNATTYGVATQDNGSFVAGKVFQQIPAGVTIPANATLTLNMGAGDGVSTPTAQGTFPFVYFVPDNGSGAPDFSGGAGSFHFTSPIVTPGLFVGTTSPYYYRAGAQIDDTWWLAVSVGSDAPTAPYLLLDADTATVPTWTGTQFNGSDAVSAGAKSHIYLAFASDKGLTFTAFDGTPLATLFTDGLKVNSGLGFHGVTPQASPRMLAQSVITAITDANAQTAVQATADALADIGALTIT